MIYVKALYAFLLSVHTSISICLSRSISITPIYNKFQFIQALYSYPVVKSTENIMLISDFANASYGSVYFLLAECSYSSRQYHLP